MERRINSIVEEYVTGFKQQITQKIMADVNNDIVRENLVNFVYSYDKLTLSANDFAKRKRVKNTVPLCDRCIAKRSNGEQCTRRKKDNESYCGTHIKGAPHGFINKEQHVEESQSTRVDVWIQEIKGIYYYIDKNKNVYSTEDIMGSKKNPAVVAKYMIVDGDYILVPEQSA
jgi:hypothetical protein